MKILFLLVGILIFAVLLFAIITFSGNSPKKLNVDKYRSDWLAIEQKLKKSDDATYQLAVLHADRLLDAALRDKRVQGQTMGERMKNVKWSKVDDIWKAHKLRNRIAHEPDTKVSYDQARRALASFRRGLKDIGAI